MKLRITNSQYHLWYLCQISLQIMLLPIQTFTCRTNEENIIQKQLRKTSCYNLKYKYEQELKRKRNISVLISRTWNTRWKSAELIMRASQKGVTEYEQTNNCDKNVVESRTKMLKLKLNLRLINNTSSLAALNKDYLLTVKL